MKKRITSLAIIAAMSFSIVPMSNFTSVYAASNASALSQIDYQTGQYTIVASSLNVRTGPSTSYSKVTSVKKNTSVSVSSVSNGWGKITTGGKTGWIDLSYAYSSSNKIDVEARLNMLRLKFPDGAYWNRESSNTNNADGYTYSPCASGHSDKRDNQFDGTGQCHGFALKLGYDLFGIHPSDWERHYDLSKVKVGDLIRYRSRHTVMITGVYDTYFTVADCNWDYNCNIEWDRKMNKSYISFTSNANDGIYHCQINDGKTTSVPSDNNQTPSDSQQTTSSGKLVVTGSVVNVRSGAGTNNKVITQVKKNASYSYSKETTVNGTKWYYITVNSSKSGWICGDYAKLSAGQSSDSQQTTSSGKLVVTGSVVNVRSGAGTNNKVITQVKKNTSYSYSKETTVNGTKWYYITVNSSKSGWICGDYAKLSAGQSSSDSQQTTSSGKLVVTGSVVNVRSGAGTNNKVITQVKKNTSYSYSKETTVNGTKWYYITVNSSKSGWICGDYAKPQ